MKTCELFYGNDWIIWTISLAQPFSNTHMRNTEIHTTQYTNDGQIPLNICIYVYGYLNRGARNHLVLWIAPIYTYIYRASIRFELNKQRPSRRMSMKPRKIKYLTARVVFNCNVIFDAYLHQPFEIQITFLKISEI